MRSRLRPQRSARTKKVSARCSDGRSHDLLGEDESSKRHIAPLPVHDEAPKVADGNDDADDVDENEEEEAIIAQGLVSASTSRGSHQQSAYMTRHFNSAHVMGLSPIEEMKLAQGEFQAKAATNIHRGGPPQSLSVSAMASSMVSIIHPGSNPSDSKVAPAMSPVPVRRPSAVQALLTKLHPLGSDKPPGPHIRVVQQSTVDLIPEEEIRRLSATFHKDVEAMTPQQALIFVEDAVKTENIIKQKANDRRVKKLPWYLIHPMGVLRTRWDVVSLVLLLYSATCTPLQLSFPSHLDMAFLTKMDLSVDCFFLADVCINCVSTYEVRGRIERRVPTIMKTYLRTWLVVDLVASFPYSILNMHVAHFDDNLRLLKLLLLARCPRILTRLEYSLLVKSTVSGLFKFFVLVMLTSHFFSCGFYKVSTRDAVHGWVAKYNLGNKTLYDKYVTSFYWSIMTMTTVGYGDVAGQTTPERLWSIFAMVNGAWIFAYGITNVVSMVSNLNMADTQFQRKMDFVNKYMDVRDLPLNLRSEIREFFFNTRITVDAKLKNESKILSEMSALLRSKVALAINDSVLNKMPFFEGADHNFLMELALSMKMVCMPPHEEVIIEGEIGEEMFFIFRGAVEVMKAGLQVAVLGEKQYFGEMAILNENCLRTATVMTLCFCELRMLTREKFLLALTHYPSMRQKIAKIIHRRNQAVARVAKAANGRRMSTDKVLAKKRRTKKEPKLETISSEKSYAESRSESAGSLAADDDDASESESGPTEEPPAANTDPGDSLSPSKSSFVEDDGSGQLTTDLADTSSRGQVAGTTMGRISFCHPAAEPGDTARQQILELYQGQEVLVSHVLQVHNKWMHLQTQMRQMHQELEFYRATYGTTARNATLAARHEEPDPPEMTAVASAVMAGEDAAAVSAAYRTDCNDQLQQEREGGRGEE